MTVFHELLNKRGKTFRIRFGPLIPQRTSPRAMRRRSPNACRRT